MASPCRPACRTWSLNSNRARPTLPRDLLALTVSLLPSAALHQRPVYAQRYVFVRHQRPFSGCPQHSMSLNQPRLPLQSRDSCVPVSALRTLAERQRILGARVAPRFDGSLLEDKPNRKGACKWTTTISHLSTRTRGTPSRAALSKSPAR